MQQHASESWSSWLWAICVFVKDLQVNFNDPAAILGPAGIFMVQYCRRHLAVLVTQPIQREVKENLQRCSEWQKESSPIKWACVRSENKPSYESWLRDWQRLYQNNGPYRCQQFQAHVQKDKGQKWVPLWVKIWMFSDTN